MNSQENNCVQGTGFFRTFKNYLLQPEPLSLPASQNLGAKPAFPANHRQPRGPIRFSLRDTALQ